MAAANIDVETDRFGNPADNCQIANWVYRRKKPATGKGLRHLGSGERMKVR
jgi:hypothetical protein